MSSAKALGTLRLLLQSGVDVMTQTPLLSECLKRLVPSFSLSLIRVDASCAPHQHYSEHFDEFSHRLFAESGHHFSAASDDPAAFGNLLRAPVPYGNLVRGGDAFERGATYQHLFSRNGIHHVLDVALRDRQGPLGILGIFREKGAKPFGRSDVHLIAQVYDALVHAFRAEPLPSDFDEADAAVLLADHAGVIQWATPTARAWLEDALGGPERAHLMGANVLPAACRDLARRLQKRESPTLCLTVPGGRLRLRAYTLDPMSPSGGESPIAIHLQLEMSRRLKVLRALERSPLTERQRLIALGHLDGLGPDALCDSLGITKATLKSYQKDLYRRLDVNSSAELVAALNAQAASATFDLERHLPRASRAG